MTKLPGLDLGLDLRGFLYPLLLGNLDLLFLLGNDVSEVTGTERTEVPVLMRSVPHTRFPAMTRFVARHRDGSRCAAVTVDLRQEYTEHSVGRPGECCSPGRRMPLRQELLLQLDNLTSQGCGTDVVVAAILEKIHLPFGTASNFAAHLRKLSR